MISINIKEIPVHVGDLIRVSTQVVEGTKTRVQVFEGIVIRIHGRGENGTFSVRKIGAAGIGVERSWPINSNSIVKIEVRKKTSGVRRSKLYYLRDLTGKAAVRV